MIEDYDEELREESENTNWWEEYRFEVTNEQINKAIDDTLVAMSRISSEKNNNIVLK